MSLLAGKGIPVFSIKEAVQILLLPERYKQFESGQVTQFQNRMRTNTEHGTLCSAKPLIPER
jgi:hypothetical protein